MPCGTLDEMLCVTWDIGLDVMRAVGCGTVE